MNKKYNMDMNSSFLFVTSSLKASYIAYYIIGLLPLPSSTMMIVICLSVLFLFMLRRNTSIIYFTFLSSLEQVICWW